MYKSMAELIFENEYLLTQNAIQEFNESAGTYLIFTTPEK